MKVKNVIDECGKFDEYGDFVIDPEKILNK